MVTPYGFRESTYSKLSFLGLQRYIFQRYDTYIDTRATIRYITVRDTTSYQQLRQLQIIYFHYNKLNMVITQHNIPLQGLKCRAWVKNIKDSDFTNLLMQHILLYRNIAISCSNIDIRIVGKNFAVHRCIGVAYRCSPKAFTQVGSTITFCTLTD